MFYSRIKPQDLAQRIDPEYHNPELLEMKKQVQRAFTSSSFRAECQRMNSGPFGSALLASDYVAKDNGVMFVRPQDCKDLIVNTDNDNVFISHADNQRLKSSRFGAGAIIITKIGNGIGDMAVVPESIIDCNISGNAMGAVLKKHDPYCAIAFLRGKFGQAEVKRSLSGGPKPKIDMDSIGDIVFPLIGDLAQKYIGDKVRQAERLRAWAKELRSSVDRVLDQLNLPTAEVPALVNRVSTERLEARLDPRPYRTHNINLVDRIKAINHSCVSEVTELVSGCPVSSNDFIEGGEVPLVRIRNIGFDEFIDLDTGVTKELHKDEARYQAKENMIVLGMDGIFRAQFFLSDELPMLINQRVGMIKAKDIRPELLTHWLNRPEGQMQLNQWAVKTTVEHTSLSDIGRVRIPRLETDVEDDLADKLLSARRAYRYSRFLTTSAKQLVEALIEGQLTEAELIDAEHTLHTGNEQPDRRILNSLKTDGVDGKGPPLFGDLDALSHLLKQADGD